MATVRTLFLAANPKDTNQLALDEEIRQITNKIRMSDGRDVLDVVSAWAVRPDDLIQYLNQYRPRIVHFSGHGSPDGEIVLVDDNGSAKPVSPQALKALFTTLRDNIEIVLLNACYSHVQAEAIREVIDYVVGMDTAIGDKAATIFAASFYRALGFGRTVQEAFDQARTALLLEGIPEENTPELLVRTGVSPHKKMVDLQFASKPSAVGLAETSPVTTDYKIGVECSDIVDFACDAVVLKYAQAFYGADKVVAGRISDNPKRDISPQPGQHVLLSTGGRIAAKRALFVGVPSLYNLGYGEIREFANLAMQILAKNMPSAKHIALTIHGPGVGLDETECFLAQIAGLVDAFRSGSVPPFLQRVTIVERNQGRSERLKQILIEHLPTGSLPRPSYDDSIVQRSRIDDAGLHSSAKPHVFIAMPFSEDMEDTYIFGIQGPVNAAGYLCERVDLTAFTGDILARIKSRIETASLVVADLTGANPNVYLEVGYAWGKDRPTLLIAKQGNELKFDVQSQRCLIYKSISDLEKRLKTDLASLSQSD
jgi:hypothetical protein